MILAEPTPVQDILKGGRGDAERATAVGWWEGCEEGERDPGVRLSVHILSLPFPAV